MSVGSFFSATQMPALANCRASLLAPGIVPRPKIPNPKTLQERRFCFFRTFSMFIAFRRLLRPVGVVSSDQSNPLFLPRIGTALG